MTPTSCIDAPNGIALAATGHSLRHDRVRHRGAKDLLILPLPRDWKGAGAQGGRG